MSKETVYKTTYNGFSIEMKHKANGWLLIIGGNNEIKASSFSEAEALGSIYLNKLEGK